MENLIPIIIFLIIVVVKLVRGVSEFQKNRPQADDGDWEQDTDDGWVPASPRPTGPPPPPTPHRAAPGGRPASPPPTPVQAMLEQLRRQAQEAMEAAAKRELESEARATPPPVPETAVSQRRYLAADDVEMTPEMPLEDTPAAPLRTQRELVDQTMATAFPQAMSMLRQTRRAERAPIHLKATGRANLRQAVLMSEVLGPPRAFDV